MYSMSIYYKQVYKYICIYIHTRVCTHTHAHTSYTPLVDLVLLVLDYVVELILSLSLSLPNRECGPACPTIS